MRHTRGQLIQCDRDFRLYHASTLFTSLVVFPKRGRFLQTRALVSSCARTAPAAVVDASMEKMLAHAPDNVVVLGNSSLSLSEGCGLVVILEPGFDVGTASQKFTEDSGNSTTGLLRSVCNIKFQVPLQAHARPGRNDGRRRFLCFQPVISPSVFGA